MIPFGAGGATRTLRQPNALSMARAQRCTSDGRRSVVPSGGESMSDACTFCLAMLLKLALKFRIHQWAKHLRLALLCCTIPTVLYSGTIAHADERPAMEEWLQEADARTAHFSLGLDYHSVRGADGVAPSVMS